MERFDLGLVTEYAALAPSVHNTQPWLFQVSDDHIDVRADRSRQLQFLDPEGRQLHISCGIAAEFARLAVRAQDRRCTVTTLPDRRDVDLLARLTVEGAEPATERERALVAAIPRRYTDRMPYDAEAVPPAALDRLRRVAEAAGAWLHVIARREDRATIATILEDAETAEASDPRYAEELARWTRHDHDKEGIPESSLGGASWPADVVSDLPLRDFTGQGRHPRPGPGAPPRVERDTLVLVGSDADDPAAWVTTGRALAEVLLTATAENLAAQPLGPATDFPAARARVRHDLRLAGHPQFLFRLGFGQDQPRSGRRDASGPGETTTD
jgi:nitroreductase